MVDMTQESICQITKDMNQRESVLFIDTQFTNLYTTVDTSAESVWATTLSLQTTWQQTGSVHPMEKLCSHFLLDPKTLQSECADKRDCEESAGGCEHRAEIDKHKLY